MHLCYHVHMYCTYSTFIVCIGVLVEYAEFDEECVCLLRGFPSFLSTCYCCVLYDIRKLSYCKSNDGLLRPSIQLQVFYAIILYTYTSTCPPIWSIWSTYSMCTLMCFAKQHTAPPLPPQSIWSTYSMRTLMCFTKQHTPLPSPPQVHVVNLYYNMLCTLMCFT